MAFSDILDLLVLIILFFVCVLVSDGLSKELLNAWPATDFLSDSSCPLISNVLGEREHHLREVLGGVTGCCS